MNFWRQKRNIVNWVFPFFQNLNNPTQEAKPMMFVTNAPQQIKMC